MALSTTVAPTRTETERLQSRQVNLPHPIAEKIRAHGFACLRVFGASMFPWIRAGDIVFVRKVPMESVVRGDVVLFERENRLFVHRVLRPLPQGAGARRQQALITKGDALESEDTPISQLEYLGRVTRIHRGERHIDLESLGQVVLGRFLAHVSNGAYLIYSPLSRIKRFLFG